MKSQEVRSRFLDYFKKHSHEVVRSSSLIPVGDETLLFNNAGMNQFKGVFLGTERPSYSRAVSSQKCVRAGGKHNDLDNVGFTARHHTFFEMLGNFSFGDYFKKEAIHFAWEFLTKELGISKDHLYVTVFEDDDEAANIWMNQEKLPASKISRFGEKDNFWRMGDTGPCGPCSEIFFDHGPEYGCQKKECAVGCDCDRFVEIWNLVFMQFNETSEGLQPLPNPSIDTGAGLERLSAVMQGTPVNYNTDLFLPMILEASHLAKVEYGFDKETQSCVSKFVKSSNLDKKLTSLKAATAETDACFRVVADHVRSTSFLMADGVIPSNEGRGYVLRRILRRAVRYSQKLTTEKSLIVPLAQLLIDQMSVAYPELAKRKETILKTLESEEERFLSTLHQGTEILERKISDLKNKGRGSLDGATAFQLYDTFGFPIDLTALMLKEKGMGLNEDEFNKVFEENRKKSQKSWKGAALSDNKLAIAQWASSFSKTQFLGYQSLDAEGEILGLFSQGSSDEVAPSAGESVFVIFDKTPFYAEGGGQIGDTGYLLKDKKIVAEIIDCQKFDDRFVHEVSHLKTTLKKNEAYELQVKNDDRQEIASHHSVTHLLHAALRKVLGSHVTQAGSLVEANRLRFDFSNPKPLSDDEIQHVEALVNREIAQGYNVSPEEMSFDEALKRGALALFGEKYSDQVRVVSLGSFSMELCGGTHVSNTALIRAFRIVQETGVSSGIRRIEAVAGETAVRLLLAQSRDYDLSRKLAGLEPFSIEAHASSEKLASKSQSDLSDWVTQQQSKLKVLDKQIQSARLSSLDPRGFSKDAFLWASVNVVPALVESDDRNLLKALTDRIRDVNAANTIVLVIGRSEGPTQPVIVALTKDLTSKLSAGELLKKLTHKFGGKGGGRPDFAQGAIEDSAGLQAHLTEAFN